MSGEAFLSTSATGAVANGRAQADPFTFTNTHLLVNEFDLLEPSSIEEVVRALAEAKGQARLMAGGTDLLVQMKMERQAPNLVISLARIPGLGSIEAKDGLQIGAMATIRDVWTQPEVRSSYTGLAEACAAFSTVQIMVMATIGGNLCNASPAADTAPALLAFEASVRAISPSGSRTLPLDELFVGPGRTVLGPDEVLETISVRPQLATTGSAFLKTGRVAADISKVCAAVRIVRDGPRVQDCRIALGSVSPTPLRAVHAESVLLDEMPTPAAVDALAAAARDEVAPISDVRSTAEYRRKLVGVLVSDAFRLAWTRAGGAPIA